MDAILFKLLCKRKRRIQLLMHWHARQPVEGKTLFDVFFNFLKIILYEELHITITHDRIYLFRHQQGLTIPFEKLLKPELEDLYAIYRRRHELFLSVQRFQTGGWRLSEYDAKTEHLFPTRYRREMVRDFVHFVLVKKKGLGRRELIVATQVLIEQEKKRSDEFLRNLHDKLQGIGNINNLQAIYD